MWSDHSQDYQDQFDQDLPTNYPLSRRQAALLFRNHIDYRTQKIYSTHQSVQIIQNNLQDMKNYGYDFNLSHYSKYLPDKRGRMFMRRKVKAKFRCQLCKNSFTSILGCFEIQFKIDGPTYDKIQGLYVGNSNEVDQVSYCLRLYEMQCEKCYTSCSGRIYQSQLEAVAKSFCVLLSKIFEGHKRKKHIDNRHKIEQVHNHKQELCEACKKGVCYNRSIGVKSIEENTNFVQRPPRRQRFQNPQRRHVQKRENYWEPQRRRHRGYRGYKDY